MSESINSDKSDLNLNITLKQKNLQLKEIYMNNRKDKEKRKKLRESRIQRINSYREEQVAALKN